MPYTIYCTLLLVMSFVPSNVAMKNLIAPSKVATPSFPIKNLPIKNLRGSIWDGK